AVSRLAELAALYIRQCFSDQRPDSSAGRAVGGRKIMFFGSQESLIGLDIGSASIKILQLKKSKGQYKVERIGIKALPAETIVDAWIMYGLQVVTAIIELSAADGLKMKNV